MKEKKQNHLFLLKFFCAHLTNINFLSFLLFLFFVIFVFKSFNIQFRNWNIRILFFSFMAISVIMDGTAWEICLFLFGNFWEVFVEIVRSRAPWRIGEGDKCMKKLEDGICQVKNALKNSLGAGDQPQLMLLRIFHT